MNAFARRRLLARLALLAFAALGALWLLRLDFEAKISTDVLDLIPSGERAPELAIVRALASDEEARTMLFVLSSADGAPVPLAAAQRFAAALAESPVFARATALGDPAWRDALGRALFEHRFALLFPFWLAARDPAALPQTAARELGDFLDRPAALAYQDLIPADPLLLLPDALERLRPSLALLQPASATPENSHGLVWAQLAVSPLREEGQAPAFAAIERALDATRAEAPGIQVSYTGVNRFAAASRARIEREVAWLNTLSLAAVLGVACVFIRSAHRALHLVPVIALALLGAWVATTATFERVHVVVFVLGALLAGVAIDYGFYLYMQPPAHDGEDYPAKVRRLAKPLLASCFTTVAGFALLLASELPLIRQLGVFVGAGLLCALGAATLYFATLREPFLAARSLRAVGSLSPSARARLRWLLAAAWVAAMFGLTRLAWRDDIRELEVPAPALQAEDASIRARFGSNDSRTVYVTHGATIDEARAGVAALTRWIGDRCAVASLAAIIPPPELRARAANFVQTETAFPTELRAALERAGFDATAFEPFFRAYADHAASVGTANFDTVVRSLHAQLAGPLRLLLHVGDDRNGFVTLTNAPIAEPPPPETRTVAASQLQSLNRLFAGYRATALRLSLAGLALVGLGVLLTYGVRDGLRIFAIPCGVCLGVFGAFGWSGQPLNLFHLLGAFLGVCLTHNYAIFSATSAYRHEAPPVSVRLSALTTGASFGVLALSSIPVVRALGLTVATMVFAALLVIELEHLSPLGRKPQP